MKTMQNFSVLMCVKDETDIICRSLTHWLALGCNAFFIRDNGSTDGTVEIIKDFAEKAKEQVKHFHFETETQQEWDNHVVINRFVLMSQYVGFYTMFPADVDEFLHIEGEIDFPSFFFSYIPYYDNLPSGTRRLNTHKKCFGNFPPGTFPDISIGNHLILNPKGLTEIDTPFYYEHYPIRSKEQYRKKLENIGNAFKGTNFARVAHIGKDQEYFDAIWLDGMENDVWV